jgi:hypothetical protein
MWRVVLFIICAKAGAENYLHLGMESYHFENVDKYNQDHHLIGVEIDNYFLYTYQNSNRDQSFYAGRIRRDWKCFNENWCLGYNYGLITGYESKFGEVAPMGFLVLSHTEKDGLNFDISCMPTVVCAIQFRLNAFNLKSVGITELWNPRGFIEVSLDHADPDLSSPWGYKRNNGVLLDIKHYLNDEWFIKTNFATTDINLDPERKKVHDSPAFWYGGGTSRVFNKGFIAAGREFKGDSGRTYSLFMSYNSMSFESNSYNQTIKAFNYHERNNYRGAGLHFGVDFKLTDRASYYMELGYANDYVSDIKLIGEFRYKISENFEATVRTEDYERWDLAKYQFGIRYNY